MIVIGAYPSQILGNGCHLGIAALDTWLDEQFGPSPALHLLPFFPSAGDFGFAPNDLLAVDPGCGTWSDVQKIAAKRALIIDGIFNHVGREHQWMRAFIANPTALADTIVAFRDVEPADGPNSPRGDYVLRPTQTSEGIWHVWQTFTEHAVDVRLESDRVKAHIGAFLKQIAAIGVWGVRLDAVAYYAKRLGGAIRHNAGVHELAEAIAEQAWSKNLSVMAQLDSDSDGLKYFAQGQFQSIPVNDFSFAVYLLLTLCEQKSAPVADYINRTAQITRPLVRAPRNHDGILLRSGNLNPRDKQEFLGHAKQLGVGVRYANGDAYELNCSGPYLVRLVTGPEHYRAAIEVIAAVTILASDVPYFYFPFLVGYAPEDSMARMAPDPDPRALNRRAVPVEFLSNGPTALHVARLRDLFSLLVNFRDFELKRSFLTAEAQGSCLRLHCRRSNVTLIANLGPGSIECAHNGKTLIYGSRFDTTSLGPYGYAILL